MPHEAALVWQTLMEPATPEMGAVTEETGGQMKDRVMSMVNGEMLIK